jgi:teichuronic acid biosynthesis glycosyltransferase TuaG
LKISVVIPAYNASGTIEAAIESCLRQTLPPHEIIIVDDASTDHTRRLAMQYPQVYVITQMQNAGPSAARNRGWKEATGDVIAFLDSDDTWHPKKLEVTAHVLLDNEHIHFFAHPYVLNETSVDTKNITITEKQYFDVLLKNPFQPSCIVVRKVLPERFNESYRYCEDHELSIRVAHQHKAYWINKPLTILGRPQLSKGGASANKWKMRKGELRLYSTIYRQNFLYIFLIPFLWIFSLLKMLRKLFG